MPRVLPPFKNFRVVIWPNDHLPAHVHVFSPSGQARFVIVCVAGAQGATLWDSVGFSLGELKEIGAHLHANVGRLCIAWRKIHGNL